MADREKVLKAKVMTWLEICGKDRDCSGNCPYGNGLGIYEGSRCRENLMADAYALLKEQEEQIESLKQTAQSMMEGVCLLKEQEPVPLIHSAGYEEYWDVENICPKCNAHWISLAEDHFCPQCGQAVKDDA